MNGENNHVFHTSALDGVEPGIDPNASHWVFLGQVAILAAFVGMSFVAIAAIALFDGGEAFNAYGVTALGVGGALLTTIAVRSLVHVVARAERDAPQRAPAKVRTSPAAAQARITGMTPTL